MTDPASIISIISGSAGLALQCGKVINGLHDLSERYRFVNLTISSMSSGLETVQWAWRRIESLLQEWKQDDRVREEDVSEIYAQLHRSLKGGSLVLSALEEDLKPYKNKVNLAELGFRSKTKVLWNERTLKDHQDRIRDQVNSMNLLINVMQLYVCFLSK